jgi:hypothetical protein
LRAHVPVVVAGRTAIHPFEGWATDVVDREDDLVEACERAAAAKLTRHSEIATAALEASLRAGGVDASHCRARVYRRAGRLKVSLDPGLVVDRTSAEIAARRVMDAVRECDRFAAGIDVALTGADETFA